MEVNNKDFMDFFVRIKYNSVWRFSFIVPGKRNHLLIGSYLCYDSIVLSFPNGFYLKITQLFHM